jgi:hypothetical protein
VLSVGAGAAKISPRVPRFGSRTLAAARGVAQASLTMVSPACPANTPSRGTETPRRQPSKCRLTDRSCASPCRLQLSARGGLRLSQRLDRGGGW